MDSFMKPRKSQPSPVNKKIVKQKYSPIKIRNEFEKEAPKKIKKPLKDVISYIVVGKDPNATSEEMEDLLNDPKELGKIMKFIKENTYMKDMLMQNIRYNENELGSCNIILNDFLENYSNLNNHEAVFSKFGPLFNSDQIIEDADNGKKEEMKSYNPINDFITDADIRKHTLGKIAAHDIGYKYNKEFYMRKTLDSGSHKVFDFKERRSINEKMKLKNLEEIYKLNNIIQKRLSIAKPNTNLIPIKQKKCYRVNMDLLKKRETMSQLEILDRKCKILDGYQV